MRLDKAVFPADFEPNSLLVPTERWILPVESAADYLERTYADALLPPPVGKYLEGAILPFVEKQSTSVSGFYYNHQTNEYLRLADTSGETVEGVSARETKKKKVVYYDHPTVPSRGLRLVELAARQEISNINPWCNDRSTAAAMGRLFKAEYVPDVDDILSACSVIMDSVSSLIDEDNWHIYFLHFNRTDLVIEKTVDYRIYDWHLKRHNEYVATDE